MFWSFGILKQELSIAKTSDHNVLSSRYRYHMSATFYNLDLFITNGIFSYKIYTEQNF